MVSEKLKQYRDKVLRINQEELAKLINLSQATVSNLENGQMKFLPVQLINFLIGRRINLNALYDDSVSVEGFMSTIGKPVGLGEQQTTAPGSARSDCNDCKTKDKVIELLILENERLKGQSEDGA